MGFFVKYDRAAGHAYVADNDERIGHYIVVAGPFETEEEAERAMEALRGEHRWAVFWDRPAGEGFVERVDALSGNYRGSMYPHHDLVAECASREEAEEWLENYMRQAHPLLYE